MHCLCVAVDVEDVPVQALQHAPPSETRACKCAQSSARTCSYTAPTEICTAKASTAKKHATYTVERNHCTGCGFWC
eukprot:952382-Rhodomonas_salina.2